MGIDFKLYLITNRKVMNKPFFAGIEDALVSGIKAVQLREKDIPVRELLRMAFQLRKITSRYNAKLFINDRIDVALMVGADGIHLGRKSIPSRVVRKIVGKEKLIGISTHSLEEAFDAENEGADFITFGSLYNTTSKREFGTPVGIEKLSEVAQKVSIPVFGIGGIKYDRISDVIKSGAWGVALISAILSSENIKNETKKFMKLLS